MFSCSLDFGEEHKLNLLQQTLQVEKRSAQLSNTENDQTRKPKGIAVFSNDFSGAYNKLSKKLIKYAYLLYSNHTAFKHRAIQILNAALSVLDVGHGNESESSGFPCPWISDKMHIHHLYE